jgi:LmbE family N-acetylglucosaminyl deacetylase
MRLFLLVVEYILVVLNLGKTGKKWILMTKAKPNDIVALGICAHPDDLDIGAGGTFAKWADEGASCYYLICTNGGSGSIYPDMTRKKLIETRRREQKAAAKVLGVKEVFFLGYNDTELVVDRKLKGDLVWWIRKLKPDIVVTTDPTLIYSKSGFINHSDHRAAGLATIDAIYPLAKNAFAFREFEMDGLKPHKVKKLYIINFADGNEIVDITKFMDKKLKALAQHQSQALGHNPDFPINRGRLIGRRSKCKFGEAFVKIELSR